MKYNPKIKESLFRLLSSRPQAMSFIKTLEAEGDLILFGGSVREYLDHEYNEVPRDFDFVINTNKDISNLVETFELPYTKNKFGGLKIYLDGLKFDIWRIDETWAFKERKIVFGDISDLRKTVFLNVDALFYNLNNCLLYDEDFSKAMNKSMLDIVLEDNPFPELNIARAFRLKYKYNLDFSKELYSFLEEWLKKFDDIAEALTELRNIEMKRYKQSSVDWVKEFEQLSHNSNSLKGITNDHERYLSSVYK
ncbi:hypothetical protein SAMN05216389_10190 [Oceanobacillus limi]|uniref:Poly A polymerase head domain-containing protein n=1 Tax=Oceanobacillus limi TaxID=930131 RepID=A0A1H9Y098_9BACI|nr:hypothetical protein [Oceanobacillus limi]SES62166.1 hypothetical protein SAMN05216389_10190 [Oceanobacillus limi]